MISVIMPTKNAGPRFRDTLEAIRAQDTREQVEIVVVDSGSTDETTSIAADYRAKVVQIRPEDFNHGLTRNIGIRESSGELILLTVQDAIPFDGRWLPSLAEAVRSDDRVAGAYSRHVPYVDANQFVKQRIVGGVLGRPERVVQSTELMPRSRKLLTNELYLHYAFNNVSSMMRRSVWSNYPLGNLSFGEDLDWSKRVMDAGYKIIYEPASIVYHSHQRGLAEEFRRGYISQKMILRLLGGIKRQYPLGTLARDMRDMVLMSMSYLKNPYINSAPGKLSTSAYALGHAMGTYFGTMLANNSDRLVRYGWFRMLDVRLGRGL
jgi:rhamnosyltransferase